MLNWKKHKSFEAESFDMTPIIDVVFLLIIFFMLVCQFIAAEQFKVAVPDEIASAQQQQDEKKPQPLAITVMRTEQGEIECAIGAERLADIEGKDLSPLITSAVNDYLVKQKPADKTVKLRCDKSIPFGRIKYILAGIAESRAENLDWAVLSE